MYHLFTLEKIWKSTHEKGDFEPDGEERQQKTNINDKNA